MASLGQNCQIDVSPISFLLVSCLLILGILRIVKMTRKYVQEWNVVSVASRDRSIQPPPGTMGFPVIGETFSFLWKGSQFYRDKMEKYGPIYKTHLLGNPTIRVVGAENVKKILLGENETVTQHWPPSTRILLGAGAISQSSGIIHRLRRKHVLTAFNTDTLSGFVPVLQEKICSALNAWCEKGHIVTYPECKHMTFIAAARLLLGLEVDSLKGKKMSWVFLDIVNNIMSIPLNIPGFGFHKAINAKRLLIDELQQLLGRSRQYGSCLPTPIMDSYSSMCERLGTDDENEISEGMLDLLFAGHETVASVTTNSVMLLGKHEEVVAKLREELVNNNINCGSEQCFSDLSYQKIGELKYLNYVVKEVLRLCPPAGGGFRKALRDFELGGYLIPKDWVVIYSIRETHHTSSVYDESDNFIPERWEKIEDNGGANKFHFIPFGAGARGCVGKAYALLLAKIFIIELVRKCNWTLTNPQSKMRYIPVPVAIDHLPVTVTRRYSTTSR